MFEIIGIAVVCWLAFLTIKSIFKAKNSSASVEFGLEARRIATQELFVPNQYYNYVTTNHMDDLKKTAMLLRDTSVNLKTTSWPRLLALSLFTWFYSDCKKFHDHEPNRVQLFRQLQIEPNVIATTLMQDALEVVSIHS